ncbi:hypothetical protein M2146_001150 [Lachnospiraceae bacterium PF1-22]
MKENKFETKQPIKKNAQARLKKAAKSGWTITDSPKNGKCGLLFSQTSPLGEKFDFEIEFDGTKEDLCLQVKKTADSFDPIDHAGSFIEANRNVSDVLCNIAARHKDAKDIHQMKKDLATNLRGKVSIKTIITENIDNSNFCEGIAECFQNSIEDDDENMVRKGYYMLDAYQKNNIDDFLIAVCGLSMESLIKEVEKDRNGHYQNMEELAVNIVNLLCIEELYKDVTIYVNNTRISSERRCKEESSFDVDGVSYYVLNEYDVTDDVSDGNPETVTLTYKDKLSEALEYGLGLDIEGQLNKLGAAYELFVEQIDGNSLTFVE